MIHPIGTWALVCLQIIAVVLPRGWVLCIHESGVMRLEAAASPCCRQVPIRCCRDGEQITHRPVTSFAFASDPCTDIPVGSDEMTTSVGRIAQADKVSNLVLNVPSLLQVLKLSTGLLGSGHIYAVLPTNHSHPALASLRAVVLQV